VFKKKTWVIIISAAVLIAIISILLISMSKGQAKYSAKLLSSSVTSSRNVSASSIDVAPVESAMASSSQLSSTEITADVTRNKAAYTSSIANLSKPVAVSSMVISSKIASSSKVVSAALSSAPLTPQVPASQETVTKTIDNNTIRLNVNAFTFEAFVDWSSVQQYLLDDFYVKVYKNGVLKKGPTLYGCVTKDATNTVAVEIDTYQSNGRWYIEPATYKIECYCQLSEHSMITENRQSIIPCPSATFTVSINEKGFQ
jgi:hypothetical protein